MKVLDKPKQIVKSGLVGGGALALLITPAVFAHGSPGNGDSHSQAAQSTSSRQDQDRANANENTNENDDKNINAQNCQQLQANLNQRAASAQARDQKQLNGLGVILGAVQAGVSNGTFTIDNFDSLNAQATSDQTNATSAVNAIAAPQLDCNNPSSFGNSVSDFNKSLQVAKQDLHDFRSDVMKMLETVFND